jgi:hypothetical protein
LTGEARIAEDDLPDLLLLFCGATGSQEFDVDSLSTLRVLRVTKMFLLGTASAAWSWTSPFLSIHRLVNSIFVRKFGPSPANAGSRFYKVMLLARRFRLETGSFGVLRESSSMLNYNEFSMRS